MGAARSMVLEKPRPRSLPRLAASALRALKPFTSACASARSMFFSNSPQSQVKVSGVLYGIALAGAAIGTDRIGVREHGADVDVDGRRAVSAGERAGVEHEGRHRRLQIGAD